MVFLFPASLRSSHFPTHNPHAHFLLSRNQPTKQQQQQQNRKKENQRKTTRNTHCTYRYIYDIIYLVNGLRRRVIFHNVEKSKTILF